MKLLQKLLRPIAISARFVARLLRDIFYKPRTSRLSLSRLIFLLIGALITYTILARNIMFEPLVTLELALLPYMWLDKRRSDDHRDHGQPDVPMIDDIDGNKPTDTADVTPVKEPED